MSYRSTPSPATPLPTRPVIRDRRGFALEAVLLILVMFSVIILAGLSAVTTISRTSDADYRGARVSYASEGGADDIMSQLDAAMQDGIINGADIASIQTPEIPGYAITQATRTTGAPVTRTITSGPFSGLYSLNQPIDIQVTARDSAGSRAMAVLSVNAQTIPLFQFGVFYEEDLEILPGQVMTFAGWVHTNGNLYLSSNTVTFQSNLTTPDSAFWQRKDKNDRLSGVYINNNAGTAVKLDFDSRSLSGPAFKTRSEQKFNGRLMTNAHGVRPLKLPLPANVPPVALVEPKAGGDDAMVQAVKMAWKADWYISVNATGMASEHLQVHAAGTHRWTGVARFDGQEDLQGNQRLRKDVSASARINRCGHRHAARLGDSAPTSRRRASCDFEIVAAAVMRTTTISPSAAHGIRLPKSRPRGHGGLTIATNRPVYVLVTTTGTPGSVMCGDPPPSWATRKLLVQSAGQESEHGTTSRTGTTGAPPARTPTGGVTSCRRPS